VLKGRVRLTVRDPSTGADATAEYGEHELIVIPPRCACCFCVFSPCCLSHHSLLRHTSSRALLNTKMPSPHHHPHFRWPHIFEFLEDNNALLEWWDAPFEAWYYGPYRSRIEARALELLQPKGEAAATTALLEQHGDGTKGDSGSGDEGKPVVKTGIPDALPVGAVVKKE
jgi:hypothetical protein